MLRKLLFCFCLAVVWLPAVALAQQGFILPHTIHSHNDYNRHPPLFRALKAGARSLEVDVFARRGQLLAAHTVLDIRPRRSLERLYLQPLDSIIRANNGSVYGDGIPTLLYIDNKDGMDQVFPLVEALYRRYSHIFCRVTPKGIQGTGVLLVLHRPASDTATWYTTHQYPGWLTSPAAPAEAWHVGMVSCPWRSMFRWNGHGTMPKDQADSLAAYAARAMQLGVRVRFWANPDTKDFWKACIQHPNVLLHTNRLQTIERWLFTKKKFLGLPDNIKMNKPIR